MGAKEDARKNETARQTRTERELARLESNERGSSLTPPPATTSKPNEKVGVGADNAASGKARQLSALAARLERMRANAKNASDPAARQRILDAIKKTEASYQALKNAK